MCSTCIGITNLKSCFSPHPPSSDSASSVDETESDFTDLDTDEHDSYISEEQDRVSYVLSKFLMAR